MSAFFVYIYGINTCFSSAMSSACGSLYRNAVVLVYYGLTFYLPKLGGNPYLSLFLAGVFEVNPFPSGF